MIGTKKTAHIINLSKSFYERLPNTYRYLKNMYTVQGLDLSNLEKIHPKKNTIAMKITLI